MRGPHLGTRLAPAGTPMQTGAERSAGNYLCRRDASGPQPRPYRLTVFLRTRADVIVP